MKTLKTHLIENGRFKHVEADEMASAIRDYSKEYAALDTTELIAIFRFVNLSLNYLATECRKEDFTIESLFTLLFAEVYDKNFLEGRKTIFDYLMEETVAGDRCLYNMYKTYLAVCEKMPRYAFDVILYAVRKYCDMNFLEFKEENILMLRDEWIEKQNTEDVGDKEVAKEDVICVIKALHLFNAYRLQLNQENLTMAESAVCEINNDQLRESLEEMLKDFNDHKNVYVAIEELIR